MPEATANKKAGEPTLSVREYAQRRGWTLTWVYQQLWSGRLNGYRDDGRWRIPVTTAERAPEADA